MTIQEILRKTYLEYKLSPFDAEIILSLAIKRSKEYILAHPEKKLTRLQTKKITSFAERRFAGEPIAYIAGKKEFFGLEFRVNREVLIPRPETELLIEQVLKKIQNTKYPPRRQAGKIPDTIIDVGTGSGNIIVSIAKNIPSKIRKKINFYAVDISKESLRVAKANAKKHKVGKKIKFIQSDMLEYFLKNKIKLKNIFIIVNLPYVSPALYEKNKNNLKYEPKQALLSRNNGLAHYTKLLKQIRSLITNHCLLILEISPEQKPEISRILKRLLPKAKIKFFKDLAGKWRAVEIKI